MSTHNIVFQTEVMYLEWHQKLLSGAWYNLYFSLAAMTQELGKLKATEGELEYSKYRLGSRLFLYPYHVRQISPPLPTVLYNPFPNVSIKQIF